MENPANTLETHPQFTAETGKTAAKMENFRDFMMKFYRTTQNKTVSEAQNSTFEKRLNQILPLLNNTPDHPPYAWMIQKAIEQLAEKGESTEKLISDYIKKEHEDLPWAHDTLLNHHLKNLCASGEIVLTDNQTYVFPVLDSDKKPSKKTTKNKHVEKDRDWDLLRKKKKKNKLQKAVRKQYTVKKEDEDHLIAEKISSFEVPEGQDVLNEVGDMQIVEICSSDAQSNPKQLNPEAHLIATQRPSCDSKEQVHVLQDASLNQEVKLNDIQIPDGSPGFEHHGVLESTDLLENPQEFAVVVAPQVLYPQAIADQKPTSDEKACVPQSNPVHSSGANQVRRIVCKYEYRTPGKKAKENQTRKQQLDKCDPLLDQGQKQMDARDGEPIIKANEVLLLSGSAKRLQSEGTTGLQTRLRSGKALSQERNLKNWKSESAEHLKPHVVEMHDDKDSYELLNLEKSPLKSAYRGRGRPRKFKPESSSTKKTAEEEVQHLEMESEKPKPSKKKVRGRPPKLTKKVVIENNPRGRGRPRKNIIQ